MSQSTVYERILETAEQLLQIRGFNAFSFRDIAEIVGVKTSSIHYHFPTKADLAIAVVNNHAKEVSVQLNLLAENISLSMEQKLLHYLNFIFNTTYKNDARMCLGGMLATEVLTISEGVNAAVKRFLSLNETWLTDLIKKGIQGGEFKKSGPAQEMAKSILVIVEGTLLLVRLFQDEQYLKIAEKRALAIVK